MLPAGTSGNRTPRSRDLSGNIIDGIYADGHTEVSSMSREYSHARGMQAYEGLERIKAEIRAQRDQWGTPDAHIAQVVMGMVRTLLKELGL